VRVCGRGCVRVGEGGRGQARVCCHMKQQNRPLLRTYRVKEKDRTAQTILFSVLFTIEFQGAHVLPRNHVCSKDEEYLRTSYLFFSNTTEL
jgi:hypothetical protein